MPVAPSDTVVIIGAGAFGLSTALHLSRAGYTNIHVFDRDDTVPPRYSAANDLNKIVRAEYEDGFYRDLTLEAVAAWRTPLFAPYYHQTGFLHCVSQTAPEKAVHTMETFWNSAKQHQEMRQHLHTINSRQDIIDQVWQFQNGPLAGWRGYLNRLAGYAQSGHALKAVYGELCTQGVKFHLGAGSEVRRVLYDQESSSKTDKIARGVETVDGSFYEGKTVIIAAGAWVSKLVPTISSQVVAKSWSVAHVHLTDEEASALKNIPVTYARDLGFLFEPDPKTNLLKLCPMGGGYVNTNPDSGASLPPEGLSRSAFMPEGDERKIRQLLAHTLPSLAERPLVQKTLCWFADTSDSDYIIDYVPGTSSSVIVMSGDSGHGFKMFPIVGSWIVNLLQSENGEQQEPRWRWKSQRSHESGGADWGEKVSWRVGETREFSEIEPQQSKL